LTEKDIETAIRNTFGDTTGAPQANSSDFQPQGNYSPPPDEITDGLNSAQTYLSSQYGIFAKMVPDLSAFSGLGRQYTFTIDCSGLSLGVANINLTPYESQMEMVRTAILVMLSLVLAIKFLKHCGPSI
jgi:hypothetical protein